MPKITQATYNPTDPKWWKATADAADKERKARAKEIDSAWAYYKGEQPPTLRVRPGDPNYNVILDLCGQAVDTMVAFLGVPELEVEGGTVEQPDEHGIAQQRPTPEQEGLDALLEANRFPLWLNEVLLAGCIAGHSFVKLIVDPDAVAASARQGAESAQALEFARAELLDARLVTAFWIGSRAVWYRICWQAESGETRTQDIVPAWMLTPSASDDPSGQALALDETPAVGWWIIEYSEKNGQQRREVGRDVWPYPFAPIIDWPNLKLPFEFYGRSDLPIVRRRMNDSANFVASNTQKIIFHHAGPQTVVTGGSLPEDVEGGPGTVIELTEPNAKVYNLEMVSDLASSMGQGQMLRGSFFESVKVVDRASIKDKLGQLTNFAVRMLYGAQTDAASLKQLLYGEGVRTTFQRLIAALGTTVKLIDRWPDTLPQDRGALVHSVAEESTIGVTSEQTLLTELGHDPAEEAARKASETSRQQDVAANLLQRMGNRNLLGAGGGGTGFLRG